MREQPSTITVQLTHHVLRLTWCIFPLTLPAAVVVHLLSGRPLNADAARYIGGVALSGFALLAVAALCSRRQNRVLFALYATLVGANVAVFAAHPNFFGAQDTVAGAAVQVNTMLVAMILQSMLLCGRRGVSVAIVGAYLGVAFIGPVHPDLPIYARAAAAIMVGGSLVIAASLLHRVLRGSVELARSNEQLIRELRAANDQLAEFARVDALTGVLNRRGWLEATTTVMGDSGRGGRGQTSVSAGIVYIDVDGFKKINDTHGHAAGDAVLQELANAVTAALRPGDIVARIGGDEFAALFSAESVEEVVAVEHRLDSALVEAGISGQIRWSASVGSALVEEAGDLHRAALNADAELYRRKVSRSLVSGRSDFAARAKLVE